MLDTDFVLNAEDQKQNNELFQGGICFPCIWVFVTGNTNQTNLEWSL